ncbi:MAG: magnesium transporter CorA [Clostridia bacterium]|nr:magnesium transporter CorA [Clostridia bacterium]
MYFLIKSSLLPCSLEDCHKDTTPYVAVMTPQEWQAHKAIFEMGIDLEPELNEIYTTKAEENYDSLTGTFSIPRRGDIDAEEIKFSFALDERGVVFIDKSGFAEGIVKRIYATRRWRLPGLERFLYDFLLQIIKDDQRLLAKYEKELDAIESAILHSDEENEMTRLHEIRGDISDLRTHYEQLLDLGQALEENENNFFKEENVRYFRLFINKIQRLLDLSAGLRDYTMQLRDLNQSQMDIKQNRIMTVLTIVTTIFLPLTLIAGWYGMNFRYMPELETKFGYPVVIIISAAIVVISLWFFKKKKLL